MKGRTFLDVVFDAYGTGTVFEQIAIRKIVLKNRRLRWTLVLKTDGLWHLGA